MGEYDMLYGMLGIAAGMGSLIGAMVYFGNKPMYEPKEKGQAGGSRRTRRARRMRRANGTRRS